MRTPRRAFALSALVLFWSLSAPSPANAQTSALIHSFEIDAGQPKAGLVLGDGGVLYGTTEFGGSYGRGSVYTLTPDGLGGYTFATLHSFQGDDGNQPIAALLRGSDGAFYGTTSSDAVAGYGTLFRIDAAGTLTTLHVFDATGGGKAMAALAESFRVDPAVVVPVLSVSPTSGPAAAGSTVVTVTGLGFQAGASVWMGHQAMASPTIASTELSGLNPEMVPGTLVHVAVVNPDGSEGSLGRAYLADFLDVPQGNIFHAAVETILRDGITSGCGGGNYCAADQITRWQMAIFLLRALQGGGYAPPLATGTVFGDVPVDGFAAAWIEDLAARGITAGCGGGDYCPDAPVTRAQMAVFLLKTLLGQAYAPPDPTGTVFGDVPVDAFAAAWIEDLATRGITGGCRATPPLYCPALANTRAQMAAFLVKTFGLP